MTGLVRRQAGHLTSMGGEQWPSVAELGRVALFPGGKRPDINRAGYAAAQPLPKPSVSKQSKTG